MRALDELLKSWRSNPDADATIAVCSYLGSSKREELIREVGASAETWHAGDAAVMLAVGRMYLEAEMLQEAQTTLVTAGKADALVTGDRDLLSLSGRTRFAILAPAAFLETL